MALTKREQACKDQSFPGLQSSLLCKVPCSEAARKASISVLGAVTLETVRIHQIIMLEETEGQPFLSLTIYFGLNQRIGFFS